MCLMSPHRVCVVVKRQSLEEACTCGLHVVEEAWEAFSALIINYEQVINEDGCLSCRSACGVSPLPFCRGYRLAVRPGMVAASGIAQIDCVAKMP